MPIFETQGISLHYELLGDPSNPPVLLIAGLGGAGRTYGEQVDRFAAHYRVVLPDQRGTGRSTRSADGHTIEQNARDMASLLRYLDLGKVHVVGTSTGGAIAQELALESPQLVRSITLASSWTRADAYLERELRLRRDLVATADPALVYSLYALLLFSPAYTRTHPDTVAAWIARASAGPADRETTIARLEMILAHDTRDRLDRLRAPTLVLCGTHDACTPPQLSQELAEAVPGAALVLLEGGHMIHAERPDEFFMTVRAFIDRTDDAATAHA